MIKPDVIVCWPRNCDYPLWRQFIHDNRDRFNLIIIVFTETHQGLDYRQFVREAMQSDYVLFIEADQPRGKDEDWRNLAINQALLQSYNAPWIWFTEQDFFIKDDFWECWNNLQTLGCEVMATYDGTRMHPCNILIKREALMNRSRRNFGIVPDISDHFSIFQKSLEENNVMIGIMPSDTYEHLNGLSHNLTLIYNGQEPVWAVERFKEYLRSSLEVSVPQDSRYISLVSAYLNKTMGTT